MKYVSPIAFRMPAHVASCVKHTHPKPQRLSLGSTIRSYQTLHCKPRRSTATVATVLDLNSAQQRPYSVSPVSLARKRWIKHNTRPQTSRTTDHASRTWQDYDPDVGIPLESGELDQATIAQIFGPGVDEGHGNHVLRLVNYRRVSGSLIDVGTTFPRESGIGEQSAAQALAYLRNVDPNFNETEAGAAWAEAEVVRVEQEYMARAEKLGIYQKTDEEKLAPSQPAAEYSSANTGESALEALRARNKARWMEEDRKKQEAKDKEEAERVAALRAQGIEPEPVEQPKSNDSVSLQQPSTKAWLQPVERKAWVKYYEDQATIVKDNKVPQMSLLRRLGPAALIALGVFAGCIALHDQYAPPPKSARVFPDVPPAVATLATITAINFGVFLAWRMPFLWRTMNKYFLIVPGYPFAMGIIGAQFSHQSFQHLFTNLVMLWPFGLMLHEDVGRGTFLAVYLGCGVLGAYGSLVYNVLRMRWLTYIFGSSTAVLGTAAATCLLRADHDVKIMGYQLPLTGMTALGVLGGLEILAAWKGVPPNIDYAGHMAGMALGVAAAWYIRRQAAQRTAAAASDAPSSNEAGTAGSEALA